MPFTVRGRAHKRRSRHARGGAQRRGCQLPAGPKPSSISRPTGEVPGSVKLRRTKLPVDAVSYLGCAAIERCGRAIL